MLLSTELANKLGQWRAATKSRLKWKDRVELTRLEKVESHLTWLIMEGYNIDVISLICSVFTMKGNIVSLQKKLPSSSNNTMIIQEKEACKDLKSKKTCQKLKKKNNGKGCKKKGTKKNCKKTCGLCKDGKFYLFKFH